MNNNTPVKSNEEKNKSERNSKKILPVLIAGSVILLILLLVIRMFLPTAGRLCMFADFVDILMYICFAVVLFVIAKTLISERSVKSVLKGIGCGIFGILCIFMAFFSSDIIPDIGSKPQTIILENCKYEYQHRSRSRNKCTLYGTYNGKEYSFDVNGLNTKMLEELGEKNGSAKVTYYVHSENVLSVEPQ